MAELVERELGFLGLELIDVEIRREFGSLIVRSYIDRAGGVDLDACRLASESISLILDNEDVIEGPYNLEVSSPGIERPLVKPEHYERYIGSRVQVKTATAIDGRKNFTGTLKEAGREEFSIEVQGRDYRIPYEAVARTRLRVEEIGLPKPERGSR